jgi:hypothetical protein
LTFHSPDDSGQSVLSDYPEMVVCGYFHRTRTVYSTYLTSSTSK